MRGKRASQWKVGEAMKGQTDFESVLRLRDSVREDYREELVWITRSNEALGRRGGGWEGDGVSERVVTAAAPPRWWRVK